MSMAAPTILSNTARGSVLLLAWLAVGKLLFAGPPEPRARQASSAAETVSDPPPWIDDAALADVHCIDPERGWAVGDRGAIWHTVDGGQHWQWQPSGVDAPLADVHFLDAHTGWAVGGQHVALSPVSNAVFLSTRDGGRTWQLLRNASLPALHRVGVDAVGQNWALGDTSALHPSGLFTTTARGRSWSTLPGPARDGWSCGALTSPVDGVLVDRRGRPWHLHDLQLQAAAVPSQERRHVAQIAVSSPGTAWAVGAEGLVMTSRDQGRSWQLPFGPLPSATARIDWRAVDQRGAFCCVAGAPGDQVAVTSDGGQTWQCFATGQRLPIHGLSFPTSSEGWAVGACGAILHTADGGATWTAQRGGARRAAALVLCGTMEDVPLELIARLAGEEGYRLAVEVIVDERHAAKDIEELSRAREAVIRLGAASFEIRTPHVLPPGHEELSVEEPYATQRLRLAARVDQLTRMWRPEMVIVAGCADARAAHAQELERAAVSVCRGNAELTASASATSPAWRPRRLWLASAGQLDAELVFRPEQMAPFAGAAVGDVATDVRRQIQLHPGPRPVTWGLHAAVGRPSGEGARRDLFAQLYLAPAGDARRAKLAYEANAAQLRRSAMRQRHVTAILTQAAGQADERAAASLAELIAPLERDDAQRALLDLAAQAERVGNWRLAAEACKLMAERAVHEPAGRWAAVWLLRYLASDELAWRMRAGDGAWLTGATQQVGAAAASPIATQPDTESNVRAAAATDIPELLSPAALAAFQQQKLRRLDGAAEWLRRLERDQPARLAEPDLQCVLAAWQRNRGQTADAIKRMANLADVYEGHAWGRVALAELSQLQDPTSHSGDCVLARHTAQPPLLDGALDELCWQRAEVCALAGSDSSAAAPTSELRCACDERFLYVAFRGARAASVAYSQADRRRRDVDLTAMDRVELTIDTDRDRTLGYRLTVASDGNVADSLGDDATFNPRLFVATQNEPTGWTCEAAIPLAELAAAAPRNSSASGAGCWLFHAARHLPTGETFIWPPSAADGAPAGGGYLSCEAPAARR